MTELEIVQVAELLIVECLSNQPAVTAEELERGVIARNSALDRPTIGTAVLRMLRGGDLEIDEEYNFRWHGQAAYHDGPREAMEIARGET